MRKFNKMRPIIKNFVPKILIFLNRIINLYLYFVIMACLLSWVPRINPNYPLFNFIFKVAGFYLFPPILGFVFAPCLVMIVCALISMGLDTIYLKYFKGPEPKIIIMTKDEFEKQLEIINKKNNSEEFEIHEMDITEECTEENKNADDNK